MRQYRISFGTCFAVALLAGVGGYKLVNYSFGSGFSHESKRECLKIEHNYKIQLEAKKKLAEHLSLLEKENAELSQKLMLYQRLTQNDSKPCMVKVKAFRVFSTSQSNTFRYVVVLTKEVSDQVLTKGEIMMTVVGKIGDQCLHLPVKYINSDQQKEGLGFKFRHFQELNGEIVFPEHFVAKEILFKVKPEQGAAMAEQTLPWHVLA